MKYIISGLIAGFIITCAIEANAASVYSNYNNIDTLFDAVNEMQDVEYKHYSDNFDFIVKVEERLDSIHKKDRAMMMKLINGSFQIIKTNEHKIKVLKSVLEATLARLELLEGKDAPVKKISSDITIFKNK